jgi:hypothetical protein
MQITKKNTKGKSKKEQVVIPVSPSNRSNQVNTLFPEKLARMNELLKNTEMLP